MTAESELVLRAYAAVNSRDIEAIKASCTTDIVLATRVETHHGHAGVLDWLARVDEAFDGYRVDLLDLEVVGGRLLARVRQRGRGSASGVEVDDVFHHVWTVREGRLAEMRAFGDRADAMRHIEAGAERA